MSVLRNRYRFLLLVVTYFGLISLNSNYMIITFTYNCMEKETNSTNEEILDLSTTAKRNYLWAVGFGTLLATFPTNYVYNKYGARYPFIFAGLISAISTALTPLAISSGVIFLYIVRFLQGIAYAADFATIGTMAVRWAPISETGLFLSVLTTFTSISTVISSPTTSFLCESIFGWRATFYFHAAAGLLIFLIWFYLYNDDPSLHNSVSASELKHIQLSKTASFYERRKKTPLKEMITSPVILCVWLNSFVEMTAIILLHTNMATWFKKIFNFSISEVGLFMMLTVFVHVPLKWVAGFVSDRITFMSERAKILVFNTIAVGGTGIFFVFMGLLKPDQKALALCVTALAQCGISFNGGGFYKCGTKHSRQFGHIVVSMIQWMKCVALFSSPALAALLLHDETDSSEWSRVWYGMAILMLAVNFISYPILTDKSAKWTEEPESKVSLGGTKSEKDLETSKMRRGARLDYIPGAKCLFWSTFFMQAVIVAISVGHSIVWFDELWNRDTEDRLCIILMGACDICGLLIAILVLFDIRAQFEAIFCILVFEVGAFVIDCFYYFYTPFQPQDIFCLNKNDNQAELESCKEERYEIAMRLAKYIMRVLVMIFAGTSLFCIFASTPTEPRESYTVHVISQKGRRKKRSARWSNNTAVSVKKTGTVSVNGVIMPEATIVSFRQLSAYQNRFNRVYFSGPESSISIEKAGNPSKSDTVFITAVQVQKHRKGGKRGRRSGSRGLDRRSKCVKGGSKTSNRSTASSIPPASTAQSISSRSRRRRKEITKMPALVSPMDYLNNKAEKRDRQRRAVL
ncbi:hypothetical protein WR25_11580 [Diploscapter pachys]|uniref:Major facilitator superfamily (MFS) profile domain-containing protein n=1 Tax=Diploscapter pachys TaxID=2018661 RepID=A0A2A2L066_9BILA|nr:hypothetical protein WR25_11580 [Diploscapter pachys]